MDNVQLSNVMYLLVYLLYIMYYLLKRAMWISWVIVVLGESVQELHVIAVKRSL